MDTRRHPVSDRTIGAEFRAALQDAQDRGAICKKAAFAAFLLDISAC